MTPKPYDPEAALDEFREKIFDGDFQAADPTAELENQVKWLRAALDAAYREGEAAKEAAVAEAKRDVWRKAYRCLAPDSNVSSGFADSRVRDAIAEYERGYGKARDLTGFRMRTHATMDGVEL